jgi:hypothetical protein
MEIPLSTWNLNPAHPRYVLSIWYFIPFFHYMIIPSHPTHLIQPGSVIYGNIMKISKCQEATNVCLNVTYCLVIPMTSWKMLQVESNRCRICIVSSNPISLMILERWSPDDDPLARIPWRRSKFMQWCSAVASLLRLVVFDYYITRPVSYCFPCNRGLRSIIKHDTLHALLFTCRVWIDHPPEE